MRVEAHGDKEIIMLGKLSIYELECHEMADKFADREAELAQIGAGRLADIQRIDCMAWQIQR